MPKKTEAAVEKIVRKHHHVTVNGVEYRSVKDAFEKLNLPLGKHVKFRSELKNEGKKTFEHDGKEYAFALVE